jgi:aminopeptidase N
VPLQIRSGVNGAAQSFLLAGDKPSIAAGHCGEALSVNADAIGYFRVAYDADTLAANTQQFAALSAGDRIALLDDEWALVEKGAEPLANYLALVSRMGTDLNVRAWDQVTQALESIEHDERGTPGHAAFTKFARTVLRPIADQLGMDAHPDETPGRQHLRRTVLGDLGSWGDPQIIALMRRRFAAFQADPASVTPDDQRLVLTVVARNADAATFEQLHAVAKKARNETELRRFYPALMHVRDPQLAEKAAQIALSDEIPPQAADLHLQLVGTLSDESPALSWKVFSTNTQSLLAPMPMMAPMIIAQYAPDLYWNAVDLAQLEAWAKAHVPAEMGPNIARGMESAHFRNEEKERLVTAADRYLAALPAGTY